jgi:hypothetical protein
VSGKRLGSGSVSNAKQERIASAGVILVVIAALAVAAFGVAGRHGDDHGRIVKLASVGRPISEQEVANLLMHRTPYGPNDYSVGKDGRVTVRYERRGDGKRYGWLLAQPGRVTMHATAGSPAALEPEDFDRGATWDPRARTVLVGFSARGVRRVRSFVRTAHGRPRTYVLELDGRVVARGRLTADIANLRGRNAIGGLEQRISGTARDGEELEAVLRSGPSRTPLRIVSS